MGQLLTIREAAEAVGLRPTTLRHYDAIGLAVPATRHAGQRRYSSRDVRRLRIVTHLRRGGFTLDEIAHLLDGDDDWRDLARRKHAEIQDRIEQLAEAARLVEDALACGCEHIEGCDRGVGDHARHPAAPEPSLTDPTGRLGATSGSRVSSTGEGVGQGRDVGLVVVRGEGHP